MFFTTIRDGLKQEEDTNSYTTTLPVPILVRSLSRTSACLPDGSDEMESAWFSKKRKFKDLLIGHRLSHCSVHMEIRVFLKTVILLDRMHTNERSPQGLVTMDDWKYMFLSNSHLFSEAWKDQRVPFSWRLCLHELLTGRAKERVTFYSEESPLVYSSYYVSRDCPTLFLKDRAIDRKLRWSPTHTHLLIANKQRSNSSIP